MRLEDFVDGRALEALYRPMDEARGLPASVYTEAFYRLENRYLFPRTWGAVAVGSQIPDERDVLPTMLGDWPILLARGPGSEIKAYLNICRNRGMRLVTGPRRNCETIKCPWHSWTYDLEGKLISAPNYSGWNKDGIKELKAKRIELKRLPVGVWRDLIFVNIDGNAPPFEEHCKPIEVLVRDYDLDQLRYSSMWEHTYKGNWKTSMDGGMEGYHLPWGHPQTVRGVRDWKERIWTYDRCHGTLDSRVSHDLTKGEADPAYSIALPLIDKLGKAGEAHSVIVNIFPTGIFVAGPDHFIHVLFTPDGWDRTRVVLYFYFDEAAMELRFREARQAVEDSWKLIIEQDDDFVENVQANMRVRDRAGIEPRFAPYWEGAVHHFQKMVVETIQEEQLANV